MSVAKPLPHDAAALHVTGAARYIDDIPCPEGTLHLAFGLSDVACATLTAMDLSAVRSAADVVAVICAADLPFANDVSPSVHDEPLLADDQVEYFGQPLFLVVAKTHLAARKAARLDKISYDEQPALLSIEDALAADSRFEEGPRVYQKGDALKAISGAKHQLKGRLEIGGQEHFYLEGAGGACYPARGHGNGCAQLNPASERNSTQSGRSIGFGTSGCPR